MKLPIDLDRGDVCIDRNDSVAADLVAIFGLAPAWIRDVTPDTVESFGQIVGGGPIGGGFGGGGH